MDAQSRECCVAHMSLVKGMQDRRKRYKEGGAGGTGVGEQRARGLEREHGGDCRARGGGAACLQPLRAAEQHQHGAALHIVLRMCRSRDPVTAGLKVGRNLQLLSPPSSSSVF